MIYVEDAPYEGLEYTPCQQLNLGSHKSIPDEVWIVRPMTIQYWPKGGAIGAWTCIPASSLSPLRS